MSNDAVATARACGVEVVELIARSAGDFDVVRVLVGEGMRVGVGQIADVNDVIRAAAAGADFVISSHRPEGMCDAAHERGLAAITGALTPQEIVDAVAGGADAVRLFPARSLPPLYVQDLLGVFDGVPFVVTEGVAPEGSAVVRWLDAGVMAVGIGDQLGTALTVGEVEVARRAKQISTSVNERHRHRP